MADDPIIRRLTAILYADVAGYSRLTGTDEIGTHQQLSAGLDIISGQVKAAGGRVVHYAGDAVLAEFQSAVTAVEVATTSQETLHEAAGEIPDDRRLMFRIGVNIGEVIDDRNDIYGDGVNIAARLESIADVGGICVSDDVFRQVSGKLSTRFEDMGLQDVKNIAQSVRAYRVILGYPVSSAEVTLVVNPVERTIPSIAVLPFNNLSSDPDQAFFADGLCEDIITTLSKVPGLTVIARNSSLSFKGSDSDPRKIGNSLGVTFVLEGSVRRLGNRLRVTAQLVDSKTGSPLWADRFDKLVEDLFAVQDEITKEVVTALRVELTDGEVARIWNEGTHNIEAWSCVIEASEIFNRWSVVDIRRTRHLAERATRLDPDYATAWALLGASFWYETRLTLKEDAQPLIAAAEAHATKALTLDETNPYAVGVLSLVHLAKGVPNIGIDLAEKGMTVNPGSADLRAYRAFCLLSAGRADEAVTGLRDAIALNPLPPIWYEAVLARALDATGDSNAARTCADGVLAREPENFPALLQVASILGREGTPEQCLEVAAKILRDVPDFGIRKVQNWLLISKGNYPELFAEGLRLAGLPE